MIPRAALSLILGAVLAGVLGGVEVGLLPASMLIVWGHTPHNGRMPPLRSGVPPPFRT